jgi:hypothetical protein
MNAATHADVNVNVRAAVCTMATVPGVTASMTTVATTAMTLRFRRRGCTQHHNRCTDRGDAIGPCKGADCQHTCQQLTRSHDTSPSWN